MYLYLAFCVFLTLVYIKQVYSYNVLWKATSETKTNIFESCLKITIIVSARNEEGNIEKCLESIINQNYEINNYEILVFDDFSEDRTVEIISKFERVKLFELKNFLEVEFQNKSNKKRAISLGVEKAKHDFIITVDADCIYKKNWLASFAQHYTNTKNKLITAPINFVTKGTFASNFLELDLISLMGITAATIKNNKPTMVNGANMFFERQIFIDVEGFKGNENIASGDDVFLMQKINNKFPDSISFIKNTEAIAFTSSPETFKEFVNQRIRWTSKSVRFADFYIKFNLAMNYFFYLTIFFNFFVLSFVDIRFMYLAVYMFFMKTIIDYFFFKTLLFFFNKQKLLKKFFFIELVHLLYIVLLGLLSIYGKYKWKGRRM